MTPGQPPLERRRGERAILRALVARLFTVQTTRPFTLLGIALLTVLVAGALASRLKLRTSFGELLPQNKESVLVADQVNARLVSASTLTLVAEGEKPAALKAFVDELAPRIRALGPAYVGNVDDGVRASQNFFRDHQLLYAPLADVRKAHDEILERYDYEVAKSMGTALDDTSAPDPISVDSLRHRVDQRKAEKASEGPVFPDGYYMDPEQRTIAVLVRTPVSSGDLERSRTLLTKIESVIAAVDPKRFDPSIHIGYTGDFITSQEEYLRVKDDLSHVGLAGVLMILAVVYLFFLRFRTLLAMALTVGIGVAWTFGFAWVAIGHLNSSTGFLVSIVVGNGINFGIIYMARYLEERRFADVDASIRAAHRETWAPTLAAAGAAMVAYGSLIVTDFRGFKHFGIIGGAGMMLCWIATYAFLPAILVAFERYLPIRAHRTLLDRARGAYGLPFSWLAQRSPRLVASLGVALAIAGVLLTRHYVVSDPMEYDMSNTRNDRSMNESMAAKLGRRVDRIVGRQGQDGLAIMTDRVDQVLPLKAALEKRRDTAPNDAKPFDKVVTIFDLVPTDQAEKIALASEARDRIDRAHRRGFISEADWKEIATILPQNKIEPIGPGDLPEQMARAFIEKDGTRGRLVYIVPTTGRSVWDAHYLIDWADSFRRTQLPDGSLVKGSGRSVIFADLILAVIEDAPKAIWFSILGTLAIVFFAFRAGRQAFVVIVTLAVGVVWMIATLALYKAKLGPTLGPIPGVTLDGMRLNFLNFVAVPISIGVGADYAVNIVQRDRILGPGHVALVVRETGGAVVLCSLTTMLGYFALTLSVNRAIVSFGYAAAAGEVSCVLAAVLFLPAFLILRDRRRRSPTVSTAPPVSGESSAP